MNEKHISTMKVVGVVSTSAEDSRYLYDVFCSGGKISACNEIKGWMPIEKFPWMAMRGDYARLQDGRFILMDEHKLFQTEDDLFRYVEDKLQTTGKAPLLRELPDRDPGFTKGANP